MANNILTEKIKDPAEGATYDLVGPTVDDDIRRIVSRYGAAVVREAIKRHTKAKPGRPAEPDWPELRDVIEADARDWLQGGDPFSSRSNYSIAKNFADKNFGRGQSYSADMKRIERKLVKRRRLTTLLVAENLSRDGYPHAAHIRTLEALRTIATHPVWASTLDRAKMYVADYEAKWGEPPAPHLSMKEVEEKARSDLETLLKFVDPARRSGMFGAFLRKTLSGSGLR